MQRNMHDRCDWIALVYTSTSHITHLRLLKRYTNSTVSRTLCHSASTSEVVCQLFGLLHTQAILLLRQYACKPDDVGRKSYPELFDQRQFC